MNHNRTEFAHVCSSAVPSFSCTMAMSPEGLGLAFSSSSRWGSVARSQSCSWRRTLASRAAYSWPMLCKWDHVGDSQTLYQYLFDLFVALFLVFVQLLMQASQDLKEAPAVLGSVAAGPSWTVAKFCPSNGQEPMLPESQHVGCQTVWAWALNMKIFHPPGLQKIS